MAATEPFSTGPTIAEAPVAEPVTMINAFTVPPAETELFLLRWRENARIMSEQPGFIRTRMYRSLISAAEIGFVNCAEWESGAALARARTNPEWMASLHRMVTDPALHVTARPGVFQVDIEVNPPARA